MVKIMSSSERNAILVHHKITRIHIRGTIAIKTSIEHSNEIQSPISRYVSTEMKIDYSYCQTSYHINYAL